ncbi:hypothetical protein BKA19_3837 [Blastococcus saxobsidens]|uniref:Uncharacterized protein n=1 Tax=Blastococcus saxobsidens TaxID=138336 RepID=A0A4Q7YC61_9ACTN|nr:hypothetical protein BKA19_3837 [Blastococcus saxobsidens]
MPARPSRWCGASAPARVSGSVHGVSEVADRRRRPDVVRGPRQRPALGRQVADSMAVLPVARHSTCSYRRAVRTDVVCPQMRAVATRHPERQSARNRRFRRKLTHETCDQGALVVGHRRNPVPQGAAWRLTFRGNVRERRLQCDTDGEVWLVDRLGSAGLRCAFDMGAKVGDWPAPVLGRAPAACVDAFEIMQSTAELMAQRFAGADCVVVNAIGLMQEPGSRSSTLPPARRRPASWTTPARRRTDGREYLLGRGMRIARSAASSASTC